MEATNGHLLQLKVGEGLDCIVVVIRRKEKCVSVCLSTCGGGTELI